MSPCLQSVAFAWLLAYSLTASAKEFPATRPYKPVVYQFVERTDPPQPIHACRSA